MLWILFSTGLSFFVGDYRGIRWEWRGESSPPEASGKKLGSFTWYMNLYEPALGRTTSRSLWVPFPPSVSFPLHVIFCQLWKPYCSYLSNFCFKIQLELSFFMWPSVIIKLFKRWETEAKESVSEWHTLTSHKGEWLDWPLSFDPERESCAQECGQLPEAGKPKSTTSDLLTLR